jgi:chaperonin GroEL
MQSILKAKTPAKTVTTKNDGLLHIIEQTLKKISDAVGSTLGPGGNCVIIESQHDSMPPILTKDGVTVFRNLGFYDATQHVIFEAARDAAIRTANAAGDGTSTSTILAHAIVKNTIEYCKENPKVSPQKVVRDVQKYFEEVMLPAIESFKVELEPSEQIKEFFNVAKVSANGDEKIAEIVMKAISQVGSEGSIALMEQSGNSSYEIEKIEGFAYESGAYESAKTLCQVFVNEPSSMACKFGNSDVILYHGKINSPEVLQPIFEKLNHEYLTGKGKETVVVFSHYWNENAIGVLAELFNMEKSIKIFPATIPGSVSQTGGIDFLKDLQSLVGGEVFDPITNKLENANINQLGYAESFEAGRSRSLVVGVMDKKRVLKRVKELRGALNSDVSILEKALIEERIGKITQGICKIKIIGSSTGDVRERRDRLEDAIMAVRGAFRYGILPGGGKTLSLLGNGMDKNSSIYSVIGKSLVVPVKVLFQNAGFSEEEIEAKINHLSSTEKHQVFDILKGVYSDCREVGLYDSAPAVIEALRNAISIALQIGTAGAIIAYPRDVEAEKALALRETEARTLTQNDT